MKAFKIILGFAIFFFLVTMFNGMVSFANRIAAGNQVIEIGFYTLIGILVFVYLIVPLLKMTKIPSEKLFEKMHKGDKLAIYRIYKQCRSNSDFKYDNTKDAEERKKQIAMYYKTKFSGLNKTVLATATKITTSVTISPNSFIDGLIIILGNSNMVYRLMKQMGIRYSLKNLFKIYYNIFSVASVSGILQEYSDEIEEFLKEIIEAVSKESSKAIPFLNIAASAVSPILQASLNYSFIVYSGMKIKYRMQKTIYNTNDSDDAINSKARKEAKRERLKYFKKFYDKIKQKRKKKEYSISSNFKVADLRESLTNFLEAEGKYEVKKIGQDADTILEVVQKDKLDEFEEAELVGAIILKVNDNTLNVEIREEKISEKDLSSSILSEIDRYIQKDHYSQLLG